MKGKLVALVSLIVVFAILESHFLPRFTAQVHSERLIAYLLPPQIGSFRSTQRWRSPIGAGIAVGAGYRDGLGVEADLEILLGVGGPHNGVGCWLVRGVPLLWHNLGSIKIAHTSTVFDIALFQDDKGQVLLANTECYSAECRESVVLEGFGLRLPSLSEPPTAATPISILVRDLNDPSADTSSAQGERLLSDFRRFTAELDLSSLLTPTISHDAAEGTRKPSRGG